MRSMATGNRATSGTGSEPESIGAVAFAESSLIQSDQTPAGAKA